MFRNKEFKSVIIKLVIFQLIFALSGFIIVNLFMNKMKSNIVERDMALIGSIINNHPELNEEIIQYITKEVTEENLIIGQDILKQYGYHKEMKKQFQPLLNNINPNLQILSFSLIISFTIPLGFMLKGEYKKMFSKVQNVYSAAEKVVEGDFSIYLKEEGEGDFNILNHQFNVMANRLENSLDILKKDKIFLKNMISDISHQLKTPLSSLIVLNDLLLEDENMELATRINFLTKTRTQLERMEWLIVNLLKVARIESGAIEFKRQKVFLKDSLEIALSSLSNMLEEQSVDIKGNLETFFYGDKDWSGEVLINIIKNSIEHGKGKIEIIIEDSPLFSNITVKDNGEGIDEKHLPHIFERFYKISSEVKPESIGIGLNLARLIVESQGGTISVKSKKGLGTEFTVTFLKTSTI